MSAKSKAHSYAEPDPTFQQGFYGFGNVHKYAVLTHSRESAAFVERTDNLHAMGPSLSLKNTTGLLGTVVGGQLALDWGFNTPHKCTRR
jgi:homoserine acetyltransferase